MRTKFKRIITAILLIAIVSNISLNKIFASNRKLVFSSNQWSVYMDSPDNAKPYYHLHFYQKIRGHENHVYCLRLDNLQPCDGTRKNQSLVPKKVMEEVMKKDEVQRALQVYYPQIQSDWLKAIVKPLLIAGAGVLVVLATVNIFTGPIDDIAAWAALAGAVNW